MENTYACLAIRTYVYSVMALTASKLRADIYRVLDEVAATGKPVDVIRNGHRLQIIAVAPVKALSKFERLVPHPGAFNGDVGDLVHLDWSTYWKP
jgi:hypothetical protein